MKRPTPRKFSPAPHTFDEAYYRRFYIDPKTRVRGSTGQARLAHFVFGYLGHLGLPVKRVLDLGCGLGQWKKELAKHHARASYQGVEFSLYLCEKFGWAQGSVVEYTGKGQFDLVICQSVFQYLDDKQAVAGIKNLAKHCRGAVYLEIITKLDWHKHCNRDMTDGNIFLREGDWYKSHLDKYFRNAGGGLFLPKKSPTVLYELEGSNSSSYSWR